MVDEQAHSGQGQMKSGDWEKKSPRLRDADGYRLRAAGLCVRHDNNETQLLLVSGRRSRDHWVVPGGIFAFFWKLRFFIGGIEKEEDSQEAALREVEEEAGIKATINTLVGEFIVSFYACRKYCLK